MLAFPGIFRGALDARASRINGAMKGAAAQAIAETVIDSEFSPDHTVPSVFNRSVATEVAHAVSRAARATHVARALSARRGGWRTATQGVCPLSSPGCLDPRLTSLRCLARSSLARQS